jgi:alkaline phosphatase D
VLVSLDGFRYDYADRYAAPNLRAIGEAGAVAEGLIPCFPSITFPNHLSIVTGMYPENHGIVANSFHDPERKADYSMGQAGELGSWLKAEPLWVIAEKQGVKSAAMFWPTSDAEIGGVRPSHWTPYDGKMPNQERIQRVLDWLRLPASERPHFITLYLSDVDSAGHGFGPEAAETRAAVERVDALMGELWRGIQALSLPVNLVVVSDHGMQATSGALYLRDYADFRGVRLIVNGPLGLIYASEPESAERIYRTLKGRSTSFEVHRRQDTPSRWHFSKDARIGDVVVLAREPLGLLTAPPGQHGFDPTRFQTMHGIFYAAGPNVRPGAKVKAFESVHVFPFLAKILGLQVPAGLDGSAKVLDPAFRAATGASP